jgi:hypothetical protein
MPQNLTDFYNALKNTYGPGLRNAINGSNPILTEAVTDKESVSGRKAIWSIHSGRSTSTSARAEGGTLHAADRQRYLAPEESLKYIYHTIKVSGQAKHLTQNDSGAFTRALESELRGAEKDVKNDLARQIVGQKLAGGDSVLYSGVIGSLSADPGTGTTLTLANEAESIMRHFFVGMVIQAVDGTANPPAVRSGGPYTISAISKSARTLTISAAADASLASGDWIVRAGAAAIGETNLGAEINGLRHLVSTQTYAGINPSTNPVWGALSAGSSSTGISEVVIDEAIEAVETDGDGSTPTLFLAEHTQRRKLASMLQSQKRYDGRETTLKAGWRGLDVCGGTLVVDRYIPTTEMYVLTPSELAWHVGLDWDWDDDDGKVLYKALDGSDAVEARYKAYVNLNTYTRNAHAKVTLAAPTF